MQSEMIHSVKLTRIETKYPITLTHSESEDQREREVLILFGPLFLSVLTFRESRTVRTGCRGNDTPKLLCGDCGNCWKDVSNVLMKHLDSPPTFQGSEVMGLSHQRGESVYDWMERETHVIVRIQVREGVDVTCAFCDVDHSSIPLGTN